MNSPNPASNNAYPLARGLLAALNSLRQAYDCAHETQQSTWEFAVELENLESHGLSHTDSRWLIGRGYVEHAVETTRPTGKKRRFLTVGSTALPTGTCLILTPAGADFCDQTLAGLPSAASDSTSKDLPAANLAQPDASLIDNARNQTGNPSKDQHAEHTKTSQSSHSAARDVTGPIGKSQQTPIWDARLHELRLGDRVIKRFIRPAPAQETILCVFQEEGWPAAIEDPLPTNNVVTKRRLSNTVRNLNRAQHPHQIQFSIYGSGQSIRWQLISE